jgi:hypothetical protein
VTGVQTCALPIWKNEARKPDRSFDEYPAEPRAVG